MTTRTDTRPNRTLDDVAVLRRRAAGLRAQAHTDDVVALTYRRRAAELELEATALAARLGIDEQRLVAA